MWLVVAAAAAIGIAEFIDAKDVKLQRRIMRDGIRTTGTVTRIERRGVFEKSRYRWETSVTFNDPWKSCIAVTEK